MKSAQRTLHFAVFPKPLRALYELEVYLDLFAILRNTCCGSILLVKVSFIQVMYAGKNGWFIVRDDVRKQSRLAVTVTRTGAIGKKGYIYYCSNISRETRTKFLQSS